MGALQGLVGWWPDQGHGVSGEGESPWPSKLVVLRQSVQRTTSMDQGFSLLPTRVAATYPHPISYSTAATQLSKDRWSLACTSSGTIALPVGSSQACGA